jgi:transcriptional regulator with PAS, ATPase and Fis domain
MQHVYEKITRAGSVDCVVLLQGESGTGKELAARAIHRLSPRRKHPFIPVNCSAIPEHLMESELFGYVRGAFSGAVANTHGILRAASGGTVFFDEIGELSLGLQAKLLRFVEDKVVKPLGSNSRFEIDVRIIVATNADLRQEIDRGGFRRDLFYRINVLPIFMPPLRSKKEDLPLLVDHFLEKYGRSADRVVRGVSAEVMGAFFRYPWPGNVRELENLLQQAIVMSSGLVLTLSDFPGRFSDGGGARDPLRGAADDMPTLREVERELIERALRVTGGNVARAARLLGIDRKTVYRKVKRHSIHP